MGTQSNRDISILNTFQIVFDHPERQLEGDVDMDGEEGGTVAPAKFEDGRLQIDSAFLEDRKKQCKSGVRSVPPYGGEGSLEYSC